MRHFQTTLIIAFSLALFLFGCQDAPDASQTAPKDAPPAKADAKKAGKGWEQDGNGCSADFRALFEHAAVELKGTGDLDVVVVTDPLCWHCRLGHKLLGEYPGKYGRVRYSFFPRKGLIGSDMAAWVLEDRVGSDDLKEYVDWAYSDLKQPKTRDPLEARMIVLAQFTERFPGLLEGTDLAGLAVRLQKEHQAHVEESAMLGTALELPGTPVLVAGKRVLIGFGPGPWLEALDQKSVCE